ncbi:MAG TPA: UDP-4-amino-4,6-dideoxy-N-acetyl-beta-L-altrosamine transaminase [Azospirillaceae bacterium]|nr:UDP-4-amino-4,6-dideoxy-N-acetyl-beta-L-altrosamine transaminase [Azospirillaceae bacterium]
MTDKPFLPYGRQQLDDDDFEAVARVLASDWLTQGPAVAAFERAFAEKVGARHAVACANGTAALHLACLALELKPGDAVVVPSVTFLATANMPFLCGAEVVFADVDPATGLMRRADAEEALRRARSAGLEVRAAFPVHLAGQAADMDGLAGLAEENDFELVEDACHAVGTRVLHADGTEAMVGACDRAAMACFSFHPVKTMTTGEGGMVTTDDDLLAGRLRRFVTHGMTRDPDAFAYKLEAFDERGEPNPWYYEMHEPGLNYRLTDIQAALGLSQLGKLDRFVARRAALAAEYDRLLEPMAPLVRPAGRAEFCRPAWHLYAVHIDFEEAGVSRAAVMNALRAEGIGTQVHYIPVHGQPFWRRRYGSQDLPGAAAWYGRCLSLPLFPTMEPGDPARVVAALARALGVAGPPEDVEGINRLGVA